MGKSFWAHALQDEKIRLHAADVYRQPALRRTTCVIGFDGSPRQERIAPNRAEISEALHAEMKPEDIWRATLARATRGRAERSSAAGFLEEVKDIARSPAKHASNLTRFDDEIAKQGRKILVMFDALDVLGENWNETRLLTQGLLRQALEARAFKSIRIKLFMRSDQYEDDELFTFPDASKVRNDRVDLEWSADSLYNLMFHRLKSDSNSSDCFSNLRSEVSLHDTGLESLQKALIDRIAGEFMGANAKRGRVYTWVPQHLADANGQTS